MSYQQIEHDDAFDVFGDVEPRDIELVANENTIETIEPIKPREIKTGFSWAAFGGGLAALLWIGGAIGGPLSYFGIDAVMQMNPAIQAGLVALAMGPAILFWLGAAAAGESLKARRLGTELAKMVQLSQIPTEVGENQAQRITYVVKNELEQLNDAVAQAVNRLNELETIAQRNAAMFDNAVAASRMNVEMMSDHLAQQRGVIVELNGELKGQTETMSNTIGRQVRLMREASKLVKSEMGAAEDALESHLSSFAASAHVMAERTSQFHQVADAASAATANLNGTMTNMLEGLGEATKMSDAARKSAEHAVLAANETASAVRETTRSAVLEAKRAAQTIRAETAALQDAALETFARLQDAASAARIASEESQAAADRHAASIEKRLSALASTATMKKPAAPAPVAAPAPAPRVEQRDLYAAATVARDVRPQERTVEQRPSSKGLKGFGGWPNFIPQRDEDHRVKATVQPETADAFELVDFQPKAKNPDAILQNDALELVAKAGVDVDAALQPSDLEQIAQRSRHGANARRTAVEELAPVAVSRIARHLKRNNDAKVAATEFRARPDLAKSEKRGEASDLVRAYLLIDAALD